MLSFKHFFVLMAVILAVSVNAQGREMTVEESYLQESIEIMIIRETARGNTREQKMISLEYIGEAIERGNNSDEIRQALEYLAWEGRRSVARENGRVVNNFPDVRRQAAKYLGQMGTEEARKSLIGVLRGENEPMVLQEAIKSLGDIGTNDNNESVHTIVYIMNRQNNLNPDNLMALAAIDAFEKIARNTGTLGPDAVQVLMSIAGGHYITPVKERARQSLADLRTYGR